MLIFLYHRFFKYLIWKKKIKYWLWKIKEIICKTFLYLVYQFSLRFTGFSNFISLQKQYQMYTLKTGNLFIQCGSQNLQPHKWNKKLCLHDALIILWIQQFGEVCMYDDSTLMVKRFDYFLQLQEITTLGILYNNYLLWW